MIYGNYETNYMISLLSSTINQKNPVVPVRATNWRELFYLGEYHRITNIAFYSLIGVVDAVPKLWENRFAKSFRKWVSIHAMQDKEMQGILQAMGKAKIKHIVLREWELKDFYLQTDMRVVEDMKILVFHKDEREIKVLMNELGFHCEGGIGPSAIAFYKTIHTRVIFCFELFPTNRRLGPYFSKIWTKVEPVTEKGYRYRLQNDDLYIYMTACICDDYARGEVDIRAVLDVYLYLDMFSRVINWSYVDSVLSSLGLYQLSKCIERVAGLWFGKTEDEEDDAVMSVEAYLWSKGAYGRAISMQLLPMIKEMEKWERQDNRRKKVKNFILWWFPGFTYMRGMFPALRVLPILLPACWGIRLLRKACFSIKVKGIHFYRLHLKEPDRTGDDELWDGDFLEDTPPKKESKRRFFKGKKKKEPEIEVRIPEWKKQEDEKLEKELAESGENSKESEEGEIQQND